MMANVEEEVPDAFVCAITSELFADPVLLGDTGHTFERAAIEKWLKTKSTDPLTNLRVTSFVLAPNNCLKAAMEAFFELQFGRVIQPNELKGFNHVPTRLKRIELNGQYHQHKVTVLKGSENMQREGKICVRLGYHPNFVKFYGRTCLNKDNQPIVGLPNSFVVEFAPLGCLAEYLGKLKSTANYLSTTQLLLIAEQVADGMAAVHAQSVVHRSLAASSIFVFEVDSADHCDARVLVKVGNFTHSIIVKTKDIVCTSEDSMDPHRYMAPEAISNHRWSTESDVWSFGVLLWEIFSSGSLPYRSIRTDDEVACRVVNGSLALSQPDECPEDVWELALLCFNRDISARPTMKELKTALQIIRFTLIYKSASLKVLPPRQFSSVQVSARRLTQDDDWNCIENDRFHLFEQEEGDVGNKNAKQAFEEITEVTIEFHVGEQQKCCSQLTYIPEFKPNDTFRLKDFVGVSYLHYEFEIGVNLFTFMTTVGAKGCILLTGTDGYSEICPFEAPHGMIRISKHLRIKHNNEVENVSLQEGEEMLLVPSDDPLYLHRHILPGFLALTHRLFIGDRYQPIICDNDLSVGCLWHLISVVPNLSVQSKLNRTSKIVLLRTERNLWWRWEEVSATNSVDYINDVLSQMEGGWFINCTFEAPATWFDGMEITILPPKVHKVKVSLFNKDSKICQHIVTYSDFAARRFLAANEMLVGNDGKKLDSFKTLVQLGVSWEVSIEQLKRSCDNCLSSSNTLTIATDPDPDLQVFFKGLGKSIVLSVKSSFSVMLLKQMVHDLEGVPPNQQRLLISGKQLADDCSLSDYHIKKEDTIYMILKLGGVSKETNLETQNETAGTTES